MFLGVNYFLEYVKCQVSGGDPSPMGGWAVANNTGLVWSTVNTYSRWRPAVCQQRWLLTGNGVSGLTQTRCDLKYPVSNGQSAVSAVHCCRRHIALSVTLHHYIRYLESVIIHPNVGVTIHPALVINVPCKHETAYSDAHLSLNRNKRSASCSNMISVYYSNDKLGQRS